MKNLSKMKAQDPSDQFQKLSFTQIYKNLLMISDYFTHLKDF